MTRRPLSLAVVSCFIVAALGGSAIGQLTVVSPGARANVEAPELSDTPSDAFRIQWLYPASDFDAIPEGGAFISGHALRADASEVDFGTQTFSDTTFILSTTTENSLTGTFDDNTGANATVVFQGTTTSSYPVDGPLGGPNPFGDDVEYDNLFFYDPSTMGNLLLEHLAPTGTGVAGLSKDWDNTGNVTVVFNFDHMAEVASGQGSSIIVTRFTIVPEPSTLTLGALALVGLYFCRRRQALRRTVASCFIVCLMFAPASAGTLSLDTFDDQGANFPPVQWTPRSDRPGDYDGSSGDYVLATTEESTARLRANVLNVTFADISVRTQVRLSIDRDAGIDIRQQNHLGDQIGYSARVGIFAFGGQDVTVVSLIRQDAGSQIIRDFGGTTLDNIDLLNEDVMLQLDAFGDKLELWAWRAGDAMPEQPQFSVTDATYSTGILGINSGGVSNSNPVTFRFVQVEDVPITVTIPEPSTLSLGALALAGLYLCRRRHWSPGCCRPRTESLEGKDHETVSCIGAAGGILSGREGRS